MGWLKRAFGGGGREPRDVDAALRAALLAVLDRDLDRAEEMLTHALRMDSGGVDSYLALARLFRMRGEIGRAIRIHQNLLLRVDLAPEQSTAALFDLASDFHQGGFLRRAIASYEEVLAQAPRHVRALRALAELLEEVREYPRAIDAARKLARLEGRSPAPDEAALLVEMARTAQAEGRSDDARRAVKRALRRDRSAVSAWLLLGELESERGRNKAALAAWSRIPELDPRSGPDVYSRLESSYAALDRARDYEAHLRKLLESRPDDRGARLALARTLATRGDAEVALGELQQILQLAPDDLEARAALGRLLIAEHRDRDAARELGELLDLLGRRGLLRTPEKLE